MPSTAGRHEICAGSHRALYAVYPLCCCGGSIALCGHLALRRLVDELSTLRRPEILAKWVLWIVAVSAAAELLKAVLERWKNVRSELLDRQKEVLYTEKFLRMDYADCDRQETRDLFSQIRQNADWSGWGFAHLKLYYTQAVQGITGILGAAALTVSLFTRQVPTSAGKLTALNHRFSLWASFC